MVTTRGRHRDESGVSRPLDLQDGVTGHAVGRCEASLAGGEQLLDYRFFVLGASSFVRTVTFIECGLVLQHSSSDRLPELDPMARCA